MKDTTLETGTHLGFDWKIRHNGIGYRCGYVRIPVGHPWHGKDDSSSGFDPNIHGGITYGQEEPDGEWWIGFDCAHLGDAPDFSLPCEHRPYHSSGIVRTQSYVRAECLSLCEQAAQAGKDRP